MPLTVGERLGSCEILGLIDAGGMGEVYRARDTRLKREVALKILPEAFARDPGRMARFQREAEVLASLNHYEYCGDIRRGRTRFGDGIRRRRIAQGSDAFR
jgi:serine/threonine protein kinase